MKFGLVEERVFRPSNVSDLVPRAKPYIDRLVHVSGWHENVAMRELYPEDEVVGFVVEFAADVPRSELFWPGLGWPDNKQPAHHAGSGRENSSPACLTCARSCGILTVEKQRMEKLDHKLAYKKHMGCGELDSSFGAHHCAAARFRLALIHAKKLGDQVRIDLAAERYGEELLWDV